MNSLDIRGSFKGQLSNKVPGTSLPSNDHDASPRGSTTRPDAKTPTSIILTPMKPSSNLYEHTGRHSIDASAPTTSMPASRSSLQARLPSLKLSTTSLHLPRLTSHATIASPKDNQSLPSLLSLPKDIIIHLLIHYLDFNTLLALRSTCCSLHNLLPSSLLSRIRNDILATLISSEASHLDLYRNSHPRQPYSHLWDLFYAAFEWQLQERPASHLTCYGCLELKPLSAFVERMSSRGTGLGGKAAEHRRCKDCMRRYIGIGGVWWREHWVRKSETRRRRGHAERWARWMTRGERLVKVGKGEEMGVCKVCGMGGEELYWGCGGCFEKEEAKKRKEYWDDLGLGDGEEDEDEDKEGLTRGDRTAKWIIDKLGSYRTKKEKKKRRKMARRREGGGRWWRRVVRGSVSWEGSWEGRVEALVEYLNGKEVKGIDDCGDSMTPQMVVKNEWKALDQIPPRKDKREARCSSCWMPTCYRKHYMLGMAHEKKLPFDRWCDTCQQEQKEKIVKRKRHTVTDTELDEAIEAVRVLFV